MRQFGILLLLLLLVGFLAWLNNISDYGSQLNVMEMTYLTQNALFSASIASKCLLFTFLIMIYPIAGFYTLGHVGFSLANC